MNTLDAIGAMMTARTMTAYRLSKEIGRSNSYVSSLFNKGSDPSSMLLARMADACGYDLLLVPREGGESIRIDPGE